MPDDINVTLRQMKRFIDEAAANPHFKQFVAKIIQRGTMPKNYYSSQREYEVARLRAIWDWVHENIRYINDGFDSKNQMPDEVLRDVENILRGGAGDCDDHTILVAAMVKSAFEGPYYPGTDVMASPVEVYLWGRGNVPTHIFPMAVLYNGDKIVMDTAGKVGSGFGDLPSRDGTYWPANLYGMHYPSE